MDILTFIKALLDNYVHLLPEGVAGILVVIGTFRVIFKPLFSLAYAITSLTKTESDDALVKKVESSELVKWILYFIDWFASIKIKK